MKNLFATLLLVGSTLALAACDTTGSNNEEISTPYNMSRTATHDGSAATEVAPAEEVFQQAQKK